MTGRAALRPGQKYCQEISHRDGVTSVGRAGASDHVSPREGLLTVPRRRGFVSMTEAEAPALRCDVNTSGGHMDDTPPGSAGAPSGAIGS